MDHNKKVIEIPLDDVLPNRFQPRIKFNEDSIIELSESIKEHGVIQPIVVRPVGDKFEIIAGERRYKASCMAGLSKIPALVTDLNDKDSAEVALIENVQRKDLTPIEEAISYKKILDMGYLTQEKLAEKLGKKQPTVANKLRLLNLDEEVQEAILEDKISERHARSILKLNNPEDQKKILHKIIEERLPVKKTDEEINKMLNGTYKEVSSALPKEESTKVEPEENTNVETPFDFSKLDFLQTNNEAETSKADSIPKFEDVVLDSNIESKQETSISNKFEIPKFEDILSTTVIEDSVDNSVSNENGKFVEAAKPENTNGYINLDESFKEEDNILSEAPTPFVFDDLFLNETNDSKDNLDIVEIPETIEYIDDLEDNVITPINEINISDELVSQDFNDNLEAISTTTSSNNTYVANDFKTVINTIRNCAETIEKYGFKINVEELELAGEYKVTFTVKK